MTIWMLPVLFVGGLLLTVVVLAITSWAGELMSDSPHLAEGPPEEDLTRPRHTHQTPLTQQVLAFCLLADTADAVRG